MAEIILDSKAFFHNLDEICRATNRNAKNLALVLKDNAYGHGLLQIAQLAKDYGIQSVFVKSFSEALQIKDLFAHITALYGGVAKEGVPNIHCAITSLKQLESYESNCGIELKVNIGMNRNGLESSQLEQAFDIIAKKHISLIGVFGHNGYGDDADEEFLRQREEFSTLKLKVCAMCENLDLPIPRFHSLSTSGAVRTSQIINTNQANDNDLVRIGIGAYGYHTSKVTLPITLKPVASLWADKISSQYLKKGDRIGYSGVSVAEKDSIFSTYDVGYGDGLPRLSGVEGKLYCASGEEILPIMSMDCFSCESEKDKICVFNDVSEFARVFRTIPYVILTHLSPFLKRIII